LDVSAAGESAGAQERSRMSSIHIMFTALNDFFFLSLIASGSSLWLVE
jgi:hypothetical protein